MKQTRHIAIAWLVLVAAGPAVCGEADRQAATVVAWARFEEASFRYADTPYLWLGHGDIRLTIHVKPDAGHVLELLWGCKNDTRGGIAVVNGQEVASHFGGYEPFEAEVSDAVKPKGNELLLRTGALHRVDQSTSASRSSAAPV